MHSQVKLGPVDTDQVQILKNGSTVFLNRSCISFLFLNKSKLKHLAFWVQACLFPPVGSLPTLLGAAACEQQHHHLQHHLLVHHHYVVVVASPALALEHSTALPALSTKAHLQTDSGAAAPPAAAAASFADAAFGC